MSDCYKQQKLALAESEVTDNDTFTQLTLRQRVLRMHRKVRLHLPTRNSIRAFTYLLNFCRLEGGTWRKLQPVGIPDVEWPECVTRHRECNDFQLITFEPNKQDDEIVLVFKVQSATGDPCWSRYNLTITETGDPRIYWVHQKTFEVRSSQNDGRVIKDIYLTEMTLCEVTDGRTFRSTIENNEPPVNNPALYASTDANSYEPFPMDEEEDGLEETEEANYSYASELITTSPNSISMNFNNATILDHDYEIVDSYEVTGEPVASQQTLLHPYN